MKSIVKNWLANIKKYFFRYSDGFYEFPYLANSPQLTLQSLKGMPFIKSYPEKDYYTINNPFIKGDCHYHKVEEELWIIMTDLEFKKNVSFKLYYNPDLPTNYHFLTLYINKGKTQVKLPKINVDIENSDKSWTLFKSGSQAINTHFKDQKSIFFTIYFSENWMKKNIASKGVLASTVLSDFFLSEDNCLFLPNFMEDDVSSYQPILDSILSKDSKEEEVNHALTLKINTLKLIASFIKKLDDKSSIKSSLSISEKNRRKLLKAAHLLDQSILEPFPSILTLSKNVGMSETLLKKEFKEMYGVTMFNYHTNQKMNYAIKLIENDNVSIKDIAYSLGYSSQSKFSTAFKKVHGKLPSECKM